MTTMEEVVEARTTVISINPRSELPDTSSGDFEQSLKGKVHGRTFSGILHVYLR